jgi:alkyldihydroxyacetonephosphate synthase
VSDIVDHRSRSFWTAEDGDAGHLPARALRWLIQRIGNLGSTAAIRADTEIVVPESVLRADARAELANIVGETHVFVDSAERLGRTGGLSYVDLMRRRSIGGKSPGELAVPDAVVLPGDTEQVRRVLEVCVAQDIAVVPFGGGTSVVGGVNAMRGDKHAVIALDLVRLDELVSVDQKSRIAVFGAGVRGPDAERLLAAHGLTLGHVPQSFERATIGGFAATRSAGQASSGYGRFEEMVTGVRLATPRGEWNLGVAPASAAGPDLRQLAVGSEGTLGVITEVALRVRPLPTVERFEGFVLDGWERGSAAVRRLAQDGLLADVTRLSDMDETEVSLALSGGFKIGFLKGYLRARGVADPCLLILGWRGRSKREIRSRRGKTARAVRKSGGIRLGTGPGNSWREGRFNGPRQRDALIGLGVCVETLETAAYWSNLDELRNSVRTALADTLRTPIVMCHISHAYETGASLYFTVLAARDDADPLGQWEGAKKAASEAIVRESLGTISHHHAVGADHAPYLGAEIGEIGIEILRAAKSTVDPTGILNPGKLVPPGN